VTSNAASLTVTQEQLVSIQVTPAAASIAAGTTQKYVATGTYTDGKTQTISRLVAWSSSDTGVATIGTSGLATGVAPGTVTVSASLGGVKSNAAALTVTPAVLVSLQVTPAAASIATGATQQFTATGTYSDGSTQDVTLLASWVSSATGVATVSSKGVATGVAAGSANIMATYGGATVAAALTVTSASSSDPDANGDLHSGGNGDDDNDGGDDHSSHGDSRWRGN